MGIKMRMRIRIRWNKLMESGRINWLQVYQGMLQNRLGLSPGRAKVCYDYVVNMIKVISCRLGYKLIGR